MRYRIRPRIYACFTHSDRLPIVQSSITTYAVQVRKWYGWVTVKEYDEGSDSDFALSQAEELLELLNQLKMEKKYELTDEILEVGGHVLHRIKALRNFGNIKQGEIGGWIENEDNLSHCGDCWVYGDAKVYGNAKVLGDAIVLGDAEVEKKSDYIVFKNWWSSGRYFTWTRSNDMWSVGCFYGTGEELIKKAYNDSDEIGREYERIVKYVESIKSEIK